MEINPHRGKGEYTISIHSFTILFIEIYVAELLIALIS